MQCGKRLKGAQSNQKYLFELETINLNYHYQYEHHNCQRFLSKVFFRLHPLDQFDILLGLNPLDNSPHLPQT
jgi:hypothetical protein